MNNTSTLIAPFPYWGGKRRAAPEIWRRLGAVNTYVEPFAGSLAVLLACPHGARPREIVNDLDGLLVNFWRSLRADPEQVAYYADWPTSHLDLTARKKWCIDRLKPLTLELRSDMDYYDPEVAGIWVWCVSNDIGLFQSGALGNVSVDLYNEGSRPAVITHPGGKGVQVQRVSDRRTSGSHPRHKHGGRPVINHRGKGNGVQSYRSGMLPDEVYPGIEDALLEGMPFQGRRLFEQFVELAERLDQVFIMCTDWSSLCSPTVMGLTPTDIKSDGSPICGIFLDPPYQTDGRKSTLYRFDSDSIAADVMRFAIENGKNPHIRIAVAGYAGDYEAWPEGWTAYVWSTTQSRMGNTAWQGYDRTEVIWFSPHCRMSDTAQSQSDFLDMVV